MATTIEHATEGKSAQNDDEYDDAVPPLWQSVIDLGAHLRPEVWDRVPKDLAANLDPYLYGSSGEDE